MSIYVYAPKWSEVALALTKALGGRRLKKFDGMDFWDKKDRFSLEDGDCVICWSGFIPEIEGVKVLNARETTSTKYQEWYNLAIQGVNTIKVKKNSEVKYPKKMYESGFLPRDDQHVDGMDLLNGSTNTHIWAYKDDFIEEYRIHSFQGRSIRAEIKIPREGFKSVSSHEWVPGLLHPWVRTFAGGWTTRDEKATPELRGLAHNAMRALGLTFGAVDIGKTHNGEHKVIDVNATPAISGGALDSYVRAINRWMKEDPNDARGTKKEQAPAEPIAFIGVGPGEGDLAYRVYQDLLGGPRRRVR